MRLNQKEFDRAVRRAYGRIPAEIRERMENVTLVVKKRPTRLDRPSPPELSPELSVAINPNYC